MSSPRWQEIKKIVDAALDRDSSERARFLDEACPDPEIRKEVDSLLSHEADGFLEKPAASDELDVTKEMSAASSDLTGKTLSHYRIQEKLGRGGMGEVFLANDQTLDRRVALKLLAQELEEDETAKKRFLREAKSAAALDHPYICKIYEIGEEDGKSFIAMEYIGGETLADRLKREPVPLADALRIASEVAEALETAHQEHIVHRDLKPANTMLTVGGHVKVLDFGLAKRVASKGGVDSQFETASRLTGEGMTLGTLGYMSPEQLRGQPIDARSDIFSFGILLYEMLAGTHPFAKSTSMDTAAAILNLPPPPLTRYSQDIPEILEHIVSKMLAKEPEDRYQSVHEVRTDLGRIAGRPRPTEDPFSGLRVPALGKKQIRLGLAAIAAVAVILAFALWRDIPLGRSPSRDGPPSVAVLPLTNISDDPLESDYLADGISQAVTTKLTQVGLRVTPWETAKRYRDSNRSADAVARELNVDAVLVGTFHVAGDEILTNMSLVDGETGFQSWTDIIVEPHEDIFQMQLRIASGVAASLKEALTGEEEQALATPSSHNVDAYDFYLQGAHTIEEGDQEAADVALQYFRRAVELDPSLAQAHVGIGAVYTNRYSFGWGGGVANLDQAEASYETAVQLNPASPAAMRARRGLVKVHFYRGDSEACLLLGSEAARFGWPHDVETLLARGDAYWHGGLPGRSLPLYQRVLDLDPVNQAAQWGLVIGSFWAGEIEQTIEAGNAYDRRFGADPWVQSKLGHAYFTLADYQRAREHYEMATVSAAAVDSSVADLHFDALVFDGILLDRVGERSRAEAVWRRGIDLLEPKLEAYPDNTRMRLLLATLHGLLGERDLLSIEEQRALGAADFNSYVVFYLAAAHARLGDTEHAVEILRLAVRSGFISPSWKPYLQLAAPSLVDAEEFQTFVQEYGAEERRLRELY